LYVLVLLRHAADAAAPEHASFVDSLIERKLVFLGGALAPAVGDLEIAYVLRCSGVEEAEAIVADDPLVRSGAFRAECIEWRLVGIDLDVVDPGLVV
jgi:hypothetical protein